MLPAEFLGIDGFSQCKLQRRALTLKPRRTLQPQTTQDDSVRLRNGLADYDYAERHCGKNANGFLVGV